MYTQRTPLRHALGEVEAGTLDALAKLSGLLRRVVEAATSGEPLRPEELAAQRDGIRRDYEEAHDRLLGLIARQAPVAADLRLAIALLHANDHIERIGAQCLNIAEMAGTRPCESQTACLREMATLADEQIMDAARALATRDLDLVERIRDRDEAINEGHRRCLSIAVSQGDEAALFAAMMARALERAADNAVDIAQQVSFAVTGQVRAPAHDPDALLAG